MKLGLPELAFKRLGDYVLYLNNSINYQENSSRAFTETPAKALRPITAHAFFGSEKVQTLLLDLFKTLVETEVAPSLFARPLDSQAHMIDRDLKMTASLFNAFNPDNNPQQHQEAKNLIEKKLTNLFKQGAGHGISAQALVALSEVKLVSPDFLHKHIKDAIKAYLNQSKTDCSFHNKINLSSQIIPEQDALYKLITKSYDNKVFTEIYSEFEELKEQITKERIRRELESI
jgi:hypothetical protein